MVDNTLMEKIADHMNGTIFTRCRCLVPESGAHTNTHLAQIYIHMCAYKGEPLKSMKINFAKRK